MAVLQIKDGEEWKEIEAIIGPEGPDGPQGPKGESGVYTGTDEPSSDYDVWIIPDGTPGTIPTKLSDLTNDVGFITNTANNLTNYYTKSEIDTTLSSYYTKSEIDAMIGDIETLLEEI